MPEIGVWIKPVPGNWWHSVDSFQDEPASNIRKVGEPDPRRVVNWATGEVDGFAPRVFKYLREMFAQVQSKASGVEIAVHADIPQSRWIGERDLLCYVHKTRATSRAFSLMEEMRRQGDYAGVDRTKEHLRDPSVRGMTFPIFQGNVFLGICCEAWCDDGGIHARAVANTIVHECMHNKSNWTKSFAESANAKSDTDWPHELGGSVGRAKNNARQARLDDSEAKALAGRILLQNKQFVGGL